MDFLLEQLPSRTIAPRNAGVTMVMDKGLSIREAEDLMSVGSKYIDFVKLGFGTAVVTPNLKEKIDLYHAAGVEVYFGGTLFEAYIVRNQLEQYIEVMKNCNISCVEVSDGSIEIPQSEKSGYISRLKAEGFRVLSEVGSKDAAKVMAPYKWIEQMRADLEAGAEYVIAEARESGNIGLYRGSGEVREGLIEEILTSIDSNRILWEAPKKTQQLFFISLLGCNANLGNIATQEILALEAMRIGLRGDTFFHYLDK